MMDELLTRMIRIYGMEHEETVNFARLIEKNLPYEFLEALVKFHEDFPRDEDEI